MAGRRARKSRAPSKRSGYTRSVRRALIFAFFALASCTGFFAACSGSNSSTIPGAGEGGFGLEDREIDRARLDQPFHPKAPCLVTIDTPPLLGSPHVPIGTLVAYDSNPPSSGPHYPFWAAFQEFTTPVDRRYYVHDLEHGAVVFAYRCDDASACVDTVNGLREAAASLPNDPLCLGPPPAPRVRAVITPDPLLDVPVAAAAWGWTYKADCLDLPSLEDFARQHYAQGTENLCANGQTQF